MVSIITLTSKKISSQPQRRKDSLSQAPTFLNLLQDRLLSINLLFYRLRKNFNRDATQLSMVITMTYSCLKLAYQFNRLNANGRFKLTVKQPSSQTSLN